MDAARRVSHLLVGSWTRLGVAAALVLAVWLAFAWLAAAGRLSEVRYVNLPLLHPYPPAGYIQNPFNPADKGDLINVREASRVKADFLRAGQLELRALELGDPRLLGDANTGRRKEKLIALITQNNSAGVIEREDSHLDSVVVGRLADPNDPSIVWLVEEHGTGTISHYSKTNNALVRQQSLSFAAKFWLVEVGDRYLIADVLIETRLIHSGNQ